MAHRIFSPFISINAVDLSAHCKSIKPGGGVQTHSDSSGPDTYQLYVPGGLLKMEPEVEFYQDYAAAAVDVTLRPINGTAVAVIWRPNPAAVGTTNPQYAATCLVDYDPAGGDKGQPEMARCKLLPTTDWVITTA